MKAPLIVPPYLDQTMRTGRLTTPESSVPLNKLSRKSLPPAKLRRKAVVSMPPLKTKDVQDHLKSIPDWSKRAQTLVRTYEFKEFMDGVQFVTGAALRQGAPLLLDPLGLAHCRVAAIFSRLDH